MKFEIVKKINNSLENDKVIIETYKKTISFVDFSTLDAIIDEIQMIK